MTWVTACRPVASAAPARARHPPNEGTSPTRMAVTATAGGGSHEGRRAGVLGGWGMRFGAELAIFTRCWIMGLTYRWAHS